MPRYDVPPHQAAEESARFDAAIDQVRAELEELRASIPATAPAEIRRLHQPAPDDPQRFHAVGGAAPDHRDRAVQRRVGAEAADRRAARPLRRDRGRLPARAQGRRDPGRRARDEGALGPARLHAAAAQGGRRAQPDPGRARSLAGRRRAVQAAPASRASSPISAARPRTPRWWRAASPSPRSSRCTAPGR